MKKLSVCFAALAMTVVSFSAGLARADQNPQQGVRDTTEFTSYDLMTLLSRHRVAWMTVGGKGPYQIFAPPNPDYNKVTKADCSGTDQELSPTFGSTVDADQFPIGLACVPATQCKIWVKNDSSSMQAAYSVAWSQGTVIYKPTAGDKLIGALSGRQVQEERTIDTSSICVSDSL